MSQKKSNISNDVSITPNGKKLIQQRLPFKTLSPKIGIGSPVIGDTRKRKLSTADDDIHSTKLSKTSGITKENIEKADEVTVQEMVDLVDNTNGSHNDVVMKVDDKLQTVNLAKTTKKSKKSVVEKASSPKRPSHKTDVDVSKKVIYKIPSKKKKPIERQGTVNIVLKIDEVEDDDDVIPIDSEENSLTSVDGKEKCANDMIDLDVILIDDDISLTADSKASSSKKNAHEKAEDSVTIVHAEDFANIKTIEPDDSFIDKENSFKAAIEGKEATCVEHQTSKIVQSDITTFDKEENVAGSEKAHDLQKGILFEEVENSLTSLESTSGKVESCVEHHIDNLDQSVVTTIDNEEIVSPNSNQDNVICGDNEKEASSEVVDKKVEATEDTDFDESKVSTPTTSTVTRPIRKSTDSGTLATTSETASKTPDSKALSAKQLQRKLELEQKRLAKEKAKEERERKLQEAKEERERKLQEAKEERERKVQEEKEQRQRERDEKERQKKKERDDKEEQKRKEREDKEEQRRKEKEEREKKKQAEIDAKNEEKRQKDEEKRLKDEERRIKEEERVAKEEAEMKKKRKEAEVFTKFFAKKSNRSCEADKMDVDDVEIGLNFMPFRIKEDMRLAPTVRRKLSTSSISKFESMVLNSPGNCSETELYIQSLRNGNHTSQKQGKTVPNEDANDDLIIIDDFEGSTAIEGASSIQKYRAKFFKFAENRRPPYYGTWQKKSSVIAPRKPFVTDSKYFDYEIDSDDEWEDEEPGESLHGSDDEKDKELDDDYDIDNEFFVPHGHLSDEELANNDDDDDNSPDTQKAKLKIMQKVFCDEMKKKTEKIKPRLIGLIWQNKDGSQPQGCTNVIWDMLQMRSMIFNGPSIVIPITLNSAQSTVPSDEPSDAKKNSTMKKRDKLTEEEVIDLIRLIHGNTKGKEFLSKEFHAFNAEKHKANDKFQELFLKSIQRKIEELAEKKPCPEEGQLMNKQCWYVTPETRKTYNMEDLSIINDWEYTLTPKTDLSKKKENDKGKSASEANEEMPSSVKTPKSKSGDIKKYAKPLSDDEKKKNFDMIGVQDPVDNSSPKLKAKAEPSPTIKKRVNLLASGPCGQDIPTQTKNYLISRYLSSAKSNKRSTDNDEPICID